MKPKGCQCPDGHWPQTLRYPIELCDAANFSKRQHADAGEQRAIIQALGCYRAHALRRTHCSDVLLCQSRGGAFREGPRPIWASPQPRLVPVFWPSDAARPTSSNTFAGTLALTMLRAEVSTAAALKPISPFVQEAFAQGYERDARSIASSSYGSPWHDAP